MRIIPARCLGYSRIIQTLVGITCELLSSDRQVLDDVDTEIAVFPAAMDQGMLRMTYWHIQRSSKMCK